MKLALILLSALVVLSHQQYLRPAGMRWLSQQNTARDIFHYQPVHYDDMDVDIPYFRFAKPTKAIAYFDVTKKELISYSKLINYHRNFS